MLRTDIFEKPSGKLLFVHIAIANKTLCLNAEVITWLTEMIVISKIRVRAILIIPI